MVSQPKSAGSAGESPAMASSSEGGIKGKLPLADSSASVQAETVVPPKNLQGKNTKTVRMTPEQIGSYLAYKKPEPLLPVGNYRAIFENLPQEMLGRLPKDVLARCLALDPDRTNRMLAEINKQDDDDAMKAEDVRRQYEEKGYVEYEVTDDEEGQGNPVAPHASAPSQVFYPAAGRRRRRPGVARKSGATKRFN